MSFIVQPDRLYLDKEDKEDIEHSNRLSNSEKWWLAVIISLAVIIVYLLIAFIGPWICDRGYFPNFNNCNCTGYAGPSWFGLLVFYLIILLIIRVILESF